MATMADDHKEEWMEPCDCKSGKKAVYICRVKTCASHTKQPFYCLYCYENDLHPAHPPPDHKPLRIAREVTIWQDKWIKVKGDIEALEEAAKQRLEPYKCLIKMCERLFCAPSS
jgi:hypothetical protein